MKKALFMLWIIQSFLFFSQTTTAQSIETLKTALKKSKPDTSKTSLLLQISNAYGLPGNTRPKALDSALFYAQQAASLSQVLKENTWIANSQLQLAGIYAKQENITAGRVAAEKAIDIFNKYGPVKKLAASYIALAKNYIPYDAGLAEKVRLYGIAAALFRQEHDKENEAHTLKALGEMSMTQGKMDTGLEQLKQSLAIYDSIGYQAVQEVYSLMGVNYTQSGNFEQGLKYGLLAVTTAEKLNDHSEATAVLYNYLSVTYQKMGQLEPCGEYLKKALSIAEKGNNLQLIVMLMTNISHVALRLNKPEEALLYLNTLVKKYPEPTDPFALIQIHANFLKVYLQLEDYKNAGIYCTKLMAVSAKISPDEPGQLIVYPQVCAYYIQVKEFTKAAKYLSIYKSISEQHKILPDMKTVELLSFKLDSAQGNLSAAIDHYKMYKTINDSLFKISETKQIAQLQVQFNSKKKDADIVLLKKQQAFQEKELQQTRLLKNLTLAGIALLIIIIGLLYNRYLIKQRSNSILEKKQVEINEKNAHLQHLLDEKQWLLKEIHHRVKNNLQIVMSLLNSQSVYLQNDAALLAIQDSQHRVHAMSLIHQKLYHSENTSSIDMPVYIRELVEYMRDCFKTAQRIRFDINVIPLDLDVCQAIPIGLILNEAITNAIKYAFPNNADGLISITLSNTSKHQYLLVISDNGIGIPLNFTEGKAGSLGISLIHGLSEDIDGNVVIENNNGTVLSITFLYDTTVKRMQTVNNLETQYA